jgi:hypothetical protein
VWRATRMPVSQPFAPPCPHSPLPHRGVRGVRAVGFLGRVGQGEQPGHRPGPRLLHPCREACERQRHAPALPAAAQPLGHLQLGGGLERQVGALGEPPRRRKRPRLASRGGRRRGLLDYLAGLRQVLRCGKRSSAQQKAPQSFGGMGRRPPSCAPPSGSPRGGSCCLLCPLFVCLELLA